jgi:phospholipase/carboxylesterase
MIKDKVGILNTMVINPIERATKSMIWLHGFGTSNTQFIHLATDLQLPTTIPIRYLFPNAPLRSITMNNNQQMQAWFDVKDNSLIAEIDESGVNSSMEQIAHLIQSEEEQGIASENIFLGGFSQGAAVILRLLLSYPKKIGGAMVLSGYLPPGKQFVHSKANLYTPVFIAHGTRDEFVPYQYGEQAASELKAQDYNSVTWHSYDMGHGLCLQELDDLSAWIQRIV